jgi:hypothetical protein
MIDHRISPDTQAFMLERSEAYELHAVALAWLRDQMRVHELGIYGAEAILTESIDHWQSLAHGAAAAAQRDGRGGR